MGERGNLKYDNRCLVLFEWHFITIYNKKRVTVLDKLNLDKVTLWWFGFWHEPVSDNPLAALKMKLLQKVFKSDLMTLKYSYRFVSLNP